MSSRFAHMPHFTHGLFSGLSVYFCSLVMPLPLENLTDEQIPLLNIPCVSEFSAWL